jgi:hypothetical protein
MDGAMWQMMRGRSVRDFLAAMSTEPIARIADRRSPEENPTENETAAAILHSSFEIRNSTLASEYARIPHDFRLPS